MGLTYLIIGATRGIGLEFVKQLSDDQGNHVIASARSLKNAGKLQVLADSRKNISIVEIEVGNEASTARLPEQLAKVAPSGIDVFIHNAGVNLTGGSDVTTKIPREIWLKEYEVNTLGAIETYQKVYPSLAKKDTKKITFISSAAGSFSEFFPLPLGAYGQSKAALNYTIKHIAVELQNEGFTVLAAHPGLVKTDMGDEATAYFLKDNPDPQLLETIEKSAITPEVSVQGLLKVIEEAKPEDTGKFYHNDGTVHEF